MTPREILRKPYHRILVPNNDGGYHASILEFPGCFEHGDTAQQTLDWLAVAAISWLESEIERGGGIMGPELPPSYEEDVPPSWPVWLAIAIFCAALSAFSAFLYYVR